MSKEYRIETIKDICALTPEQREGFFEDLKVFCKLSDMSKTLPTGFAVMDTSGITWIDDGDWDTVSKITFKLDTGEEDE